MCGVAGAVGRLDQGAIDCVQLMSGAQRHRGPDGAGFFESGRGDFEVAFAHRRLAIIDLSSDASQPMVDPGSGSVLTFNGEIYNFRALRDELTAAGCVFRTQSDTEVILQAYVAWGPDAVRRLRGIFAFAIWDPRQRQVHLARDQLGIKPLYWARRNGTLYFASELRALLAGGQPRRIDPQGIASFLWQGFVNGPGSIVEGVNLLPAGSTLTLSAGEEPVQRSYWQLPAARPGTVTREELHHALRESVRLQLVADVPLGIFLSGGIDSSAIAALACEVGSGDVHTFNIGFDEAQLDESRHAAEVARALGTSHQSLRVSGSDFEQVLPAALGSIDQPTFDGINTYLVSRAVREAGMTVALAGTGGDELFGGYRSFVDLPRMQRLPELAPLDALAGLLARGATRAALAMGGVPPQPAGETSRMRCVRTTRSAATRPHTRCSPPNCMSAWPARCRPAGRPD